VFIFVRLTHLGEQATAKVAQSAKSQSREKMSANPSQESSDSDFSSLSVRELEIADNLVEGLTAKEIARRLGISFDTVRTHVKSIYRKLHVRNKVQFVAKFLHARK